MKIEQWQFDDAVASFDAAIAEIGRRIESGEELPPTTGYFETSRRDHVVPIAVRRIHASPDAPIAVGDHVRLRRNGRYAGRVVWVNCETAVVFRRSAVSLGRFIRRTRLEALTRIE